MSLIALSRTAFLIGALALAGCTLPDEPVEIFDPYESTNRKVHQFNKGLDRTIVRPTSRAYGQVVPRPVRRSVSNFANYLDSPRFVLNDLMQGNIEDAGHNMFRFLINTTIGVFGIFDPATSFGLESRSSGFGETLHVWGVEEGAYVELPVFGPSNERDAVGQVVDLVSNPLSGAVNASDRWVLPSANVADRLGDRYELQGVIDGVLYESADSYIQARSTYLQNRRFELGEDADEFAFDPYEDLFDE